MIFDEISRGHVFRIAVEIKLILILLLMLAGSAGAITVTVDAGGGANFTSIQDAINTASNGDTIIVNSGTYKENVNVNKQLILKGMDTGGGKPLVDASGSGDTINLSAGNSTLDGFEAINGTTIGIVVASDFNILSNNSAMNNAEDGIVLRNASYNTLNNNNASNAIFGIALLEGSNLNILNSNNVVNNGNAGIFVGNSNNNILSNNTADLNIVQGIQLIASMKNTLVNNMISNNNYGIYFESSSDNNTVSSNIVKMNRDSGIFLTSSINNTIYNNHFNNTNNSGVSFGSNIWNSTITNGTNILGGPFIAGNYWANPNGTGFSQTCPDANGNGRCDSSYMLDSNNIDYLPLAYNATNITPGIGPVHNINQNISYTTIQSAINNASSGNEIRVDSGTYKENVNINKQLILRGVDTGGGKPVVNAPGGSDAINLSAGNSTLDGFTVTNGTITGIVVTSNFNILSNNNAMNNTGDGIVLVNASNNTLNNNSATLNTIFGIALLEGSNSNVLSGNNVLNNGNAGIFLRDSSGNILNNNTANSNNVQGIQLFTSTRNILVNNTVSNSDYGIFFESSSDNNILGGNIIKMNRNNGIFLTGSSNNTIYNNHFNNTNNFSISGSNTWNTTITNGTNIIGGPRIGGNYWANPNGTGFSQTCPDANSDGICDSPYMLDSNNVDYLPLAQRLAGDLNGNGISADAGDLVLMKRASIGEIQADSRYDLNNNGQLADAGDLVLMKRASIGEITLPINMT